MDYREYADYWKDLTPEMKRMKVIGLVTRLREKIEYHSTVKWKNIKGKYVEYIDEEFKFRTLKVDKVKGNREVRLVEHIKGEKGNYIRRWIPRDIIIGVYSRRLKKLKELV